MVKGGGHFNSTITANHHKLFAFAPCSYMPSYSLLQIYEKNSEYFSIFFTSIFSMALQWLSLVGVIWLQSINGTNSNFPAYSSELKRMLSITQPQLNNLAAASDAGKLFGWISGTAAAHLPLWIVLLIGAILGLIGYGIQYLFLINQISSLSYWHVFLLTVLAGNSICWINTVSYLVSIKNFPLDRQIATGLSTSYIGFSAKIYTDIVDAVASNSPSERAKLFLLLNSVVPFGVCILAAPLARDVHVGKSRKLAGGFIFMFVITVFTGIYAVITSLGQNILRFLHPSTIVIGVAVFLILPLVVPLSEKVRETLQYKCLIRVHDEGASATSTENGENLEEGESNLSKFCEESVEEIGVKLMLRRVEFWLYFFAYLFGATVGLVYLNNLGQIAESRGCSGTLALVSLSSAFSFFGRLIPSFHDYFFKKSKYMISRPAAMTCMIIPMCGAMFLLVNKQDIWLYISTAIIGICTGAITTISVSTTTQLFGTKNFGVNHNILVSNIPIGSFLFGDLAALLYNGEKLSGEDNCIGQNCYQTTFIVWGFLCFLGAFLGFILHFRTRKVVIT
ncbi:protein NUCLEAR FUSION DEFECTIVE 4-like [Olea europaea var. sylvestris]|uniref:protein NUCLEAR FUSION DEFECTIVE 4-like n=1 Tax=Olea europaea var. sylvestris TaxID=158386 RepID=UPI000C1D43EA|nr:protein NUCLEAR FUSION DEFECTIVE 4-like [Olea europaea var. sylvestris]